MTLLSLFVMGAAYFVESRQLALKPPHQTNTLFTISWGAIPRADYYVVHMSPAPYCTPQVTTNVGPFTNVTLSLPPVWDYGAKDAFGGRWTAIATNWYICAVPWNAEHQGGYYPYMHYPPDRVDQFSGEELECRTNLAAGSWSMTNSPWVGTNVTGCQFFKGLGDSSGPQHTNWFLFGNLAPWWPADLGY